MRSILLILSGLHLMGCSTTSAISSNEPAERCETTDCFNQLQIRDFEVVDETTLIVYVGAQRCPFIVELTGTFCDVTFLPGYDVVFRPTTQRAEREPSITGAGGFGDRADVVSTRVCANDMNLGIEEGPFTDAGGRANDFDGLDCRIQNVASLTDDEILEIYVDRRIAPPPPPFGTGEISGGEQQPEDEGADAETGESAPEPLASAD